MELVVLYLGMAVIGYFAGSRLKKSNRELKWTGKVQTVCLFLLVFIMGARIGADESVIASLGTIGVTAFIITIFTLAGSVLCVILVRKLMGIDKRGVRRID